MGDVVTLKDARKKRAKKSAAALAAKARGRTLCGRGFHDWQIESRRPFDVKRGKLVTLHRCARCGATRTTHD